MRWRSVKRNRAVISVTLACRAFCTPSCKLPHPLSRTGDHYREGQGRASNLKTVERLHENSPSESTKAKDNIKDKIKGCPRVGRGNISPFLFCKQF